MTDFERNPFSSDVVHAEDFSVDPALVYNPTTGFMPLSDGTVVRLGPQFNYPNAQPVDLYAGYHKDAQGNWVRDEVE